MSLLENLLSQGTVERLGWMLVHFLWQAAAIAMLLAAMLKLLRPARSNSRYLVACGALILMVGMPLITMQFIDVPGPVAEAGPPPETPTPLTSFPAVTVRFVDELPPLSSTPPLQTANLVVRIPWHERLAMLLEPALPYLVLGWLAGVLGLSTWHLGGWTQLQRLRRRMVREADAALRTTLDELETRLGVHQVVALLESALVEVPTVVGWLHPAILLPVSALTGLTSDQLRAILAHELAHIRRYDYLANILQTVVEIFGFYHPAVWWVSHQIRIERENCCDDLAVRVCDNSLQYAKALASMEEIRHSRTELAMAASGGSLMARIARLLGRPVVDDRRFAWLPGLIALLLVVGVVIPAAFALTSDAPRPPDSQTDATPTSVAKSEDEADSAEPVQTQIQVTLVLAELYADTVLDPQLAEDVRGFLVRIPAHDGKPITPPSVEELQRPLADVLSTFTPAPGRGKEFVDLLRRKKDCVARTLSAPRVTSLSGESLQFTMGSIPSPDQPLPQDDEFIFVRCDMTATFVPDLNAIKMDIDMVRMYAAYKPSDPNGWTATWTLKTTVPVIDNQWMLINDKLLRRLDRDGRKCLQLPLVLATLVDEPEAGATGNDRTGGIQSTTSQIVNLPPGMGAMSQTASPDSSEILVKFALFPPASPDRVVDRETRNLLAGILAAQNLQALREIVHADPQQDVTLGEFLRTWIVGRPMPPDTMGVLIDVLQSRGYLEGEATPEVLARNNTQARINMGMEEWFMPPTGPESQLQRIQLGTSVQVTPHVSPPTSDRITLEMAVEWRRRIKEGDANTAPTVSSSQVATTVTTPRDHYFALMVEPSRAMDAGTTDSEFLLVMFKADLVQPAARQENSPAPQAKSSDGRPRQAPAAGAGSLQPKLLSTLAELSRAKNVQIAVDHTVKDEPIATGIESVRHVPVNAALDEILKGTQRAYKWKLTAEDTYLVYRPLTKTFLGTQIRRALQDMADEVEVPIIPDPNVSGKTYASFTEMPLEKALSMILAGMPYVFKWMPGEYYLVADRNTMPPGFFETAKSTRVALKYNTPARVKAILPLPYQSYVQVEPINAADPNGQGRVLVVTALSEQAEKVIKLIREIDVPCRQVLLDVRVVALERGNLLNLGVQWDFPTIQQGQSYDGDNRLTGLGIGYSADRLFTSTLMARLNHLQSSQQAKILATPRVVAQEGHAAQLRFSQEEWFLMSDTPLPGDASGNTSAELQRIESGTILTITPTVGDSNEITLVTAIEMSDSIPRGADSDLPIVTRRQTKNKVTVQDGGTVAVAGLTQKEGQSTRDVAIFVTAHLVSESGTVSVLSLNPKKTAAASPSSADIQPARPSVPQIRRNEKRARQVLLDTRVVTLERGNLPNLGVAWASPASQPPSSPSVDDWARDLAIGYAADGAATGVLMAKLNQLQSHQQVRILANPQVVTQEGHAAQLRPGFGEEWVNYQNEQAEREAARGREECRRLLAGTSLSITPNLGDGNEITLEIVVEVSNGIPGGAAGDLPVVTRRQTKNKATVRDGGTVAVAGLTREDGQAGKDVAIFVTAYLVPESGPVSALSLDPKKTAASSPSSANIEPAASPDGSATSGGADRATSRAWTIMRQWNCPPLLLGLTQQFAKALEPSRQNDPAWKDTRDGGTLRLRVEVEGEDAGEVLIGFFEDARWSQEPVAIRRVSGLGEHVLTGLPPGRYQIGAMIGDAPVPVALGVHRTWPEPIEIRRDQTTTAEVLVSEAFQKHASGWYNEDVATDYLGRWASLDEGHLLQGRLTGPGGKPIPFGEIMIRERRTDGRGIDAPNRGTNEQGIYKFDGIAWPYRVIACWREPLPSLFGHRYQNMSLGRVLEGSQRIDFRFDPFPQGTARLTGRVVDQDGRPVEGFFIRLLTLSWDELGQKEELDGKLHAYTGYDIPFLSKDGSYELSGLPAGTACAHVIPFETKRYERRDFKDVPLTAGQTANLDFHLISRKVYYGRVLFEDGAPAVVRPVPWKGAATRILLPSGYRSPVGAEVGPDGYFTVYLDNAPGSSRFIITVPTDQERRSATVGEFPFEKLAEDKSSAGIVTVKRPSPIPTFPGELGQTDPLPPGWSLAYDPGKQRMYQVLFNAEVIASGSPSGRPAGDEEFVIYDPNAREIEKFEFQSMMEMPKAQQYRLIGRRVSDGRTLHGPYALNMTKPGFYNLTVDLGTIVEAESKNKDPNGVTVQP